MPPIHVCMYTCIIFYLCLRVQITSDWDLRTKDQGSDELKVKIEFINIWYLYNSRQ